jgi:hypothetical protein
MSLKKCRENEKRKNTRKAFRKIYPERKSFPLGEKASRKSLCVGTGQRKTALPPSPSAQPKLNIKDKALRAGGGGKGGGGYNNLPVPCSCPRRFFACCNYPERSVPENERSEQGRNMRGNALAAKAKNCLNVSSAHL